MTRTELQTSQLDMWRMLFGEQRMTLRLAVDMLSYCNLSPEQILMKTVSALEGSELDA